MIVFRSLQLLELHCGKKKVCDHSICFQICKGQIKTLFAQTLMSGTGSKTHSSESAWKADMGAAVTLVLGTKSMLGKCSRTAAHGLETDCLVCSGLTYTFSMQILMSTPDRWTDMANRMGYTETTIPLSWISRCFWRWPRNLCTQRHQERYSSPFGGTKSQVFDKMWSPTAGIRVLSPRELMKLIKPHLEMRGEHARPKPHKEVFQ